MRVLALTRYGRQGASSRLRVFGFVERLAALGISVKAAPLVTDAMLVERYRTGSYRPSALVSAYLSRIAAMVRVDSCDVCLIEHEALPWMPVALERVLGPRTPRVIDFDDAAFHRYDQHRSRIVRSMLGSRIDTVMQMAHTVIAGNEYIAARAQVAGARRLERLPTVVDLSRYPVPAARVPRVDAEVRVVWIGQPTNVRYLSMVLDALERVGGEYPLLLRTVGAKGPSLTCVRTESIEWTETDEARLLGECDIGIMPLPDEPWERGKCGYKLIQYMACGLPVIASPVGANTAIVRQGQTGFLCRTFEEWTEALLELVRSARLRRQMGLAGRAVTEAEYSLDIAAPKLAKILRAAAG